MRALAALRLRLPVLILCCGLVQRSNRLHVHDALRLLDRLACAGGGVTQPPDRSERSEHARSKRSGEGNSERSGTPIAAMRPNAHLEPVDELAAGLGPVRPELGLEAPLRISSPRSHSSSPPTLGFVLAPTTTGLPAISLQAANRPRDAFSGARERGAARPRSHSSSRPGARRSGARLDPRRNGARSALGRGSRGGRRPPTARSGGPRRPP